VAGGETAQIDAEAILDEDRRRVGLKSAIYDPGS
jgi:hypothetical protein